MISEKLVLSIHDPPVKTQATEILPQKNSAAQFYLFSSCLPKKLREKEFRETEREREEEGDTVCMCNEMENIRELVISQSVSSYSSVSSKSKDGGGKIVDSSDEASHTGSADLRFSFFDVKLAFFNSQKVTMSPVFLVLAS
jgi:hypothetical protein